MTIRVLLALRKLCTQTEQDGETFDQAARLLALALEEAKENQKKKYVRI